MSVQETIKDLVAKGNTEDALELLARYNAEGSLLMSRYAHGMREYRNGMINGHDWLVIHNRIREAVLTIASHHLNADDNTNLTEPKKVFFLNSDADIEAANLVRSWLENSIYDVIGPFSDKNYPLDDAQTKETINETLSKGGFVVMFLSINFFKNGWVGFTHDFWFYLSLFNRGGQLVLVGLDDAHKDHNKYLNAIAYLDEKIEQTFDDTQWSENIEVVKANEAPTAWHIQKAHSLRNLLSLMNPLLKNRYVIKLDNKGLTKNEDARSEILKLMGDWEKETVKLSRATRIS